MVETQKVNQLLTIILTLNITELNELIYVGPNLVCDEIGIAQRTWTEIQNLGISLEG